MKLTNVEIHPANSSAFADLSFRDPTRSNPYNVKTIVGLDVDEIIPKYYGTSVNPKFYDLSLMRREIVLRIELNPTFNTNETYSDLRDNLYKMIASSRTGKIQLQFKNGEDILAGISGFISKFEAAHFERVQEVQLTVKCDEPMLKALTPVTVGVTGLNPSRTVIEDKQSNAPHGFSFAMNVTSAFPNLRITDPDDSSWSFYVIPVGGFLNGDILRFSSEYNNKYLYITRGASTVYLADVVQPGSVWPILFPGNNTFTFTQYIYINWRSISYYPTYWGV